MQDLEFLTHQTGVEERLELAVGGTERPGGPGGDLVDDFPGVVHEERLLALNPNSFKAILSEDVLHPVPTDMTGQVLFAGLGQEIGDGQSMAGLLLFDRWLAEGKG